MYEVQEFPFLSEDECKDIADNVMALRDKWTARLPDAPFYTLGAASYLDAQHGFAPYNHRREIDGPILERQFLRLYTELRIAIRTQVVMCRTRYEMSLPGFHIFLGDRRFEKPIASFHVDWQHNNLPWEKPVDVTRVFSFTVAVALPCQGGGLNFWTPPENIRDRMKKRFHPYRLGWLNVHNGYIPHQIAPMVNALPNDKRITLQGHAIWCRDESSWLIYW